MDKILAIKDKYSSSIPHVEHVKEIIRTSTIHLGRLNRDDKDRRLGEAKKLESLREKIADQQERLSIEEQKLNLMANELVNHNELLKELESERSRLLTENNEAELKRNQLKVVKPSITDQKILECGRKKFDYYKVLTGIRWDYVMLKTSIKGFVTNGDDYVHPFCLDKNDKRVESKLWREIERSTNHSKIEKSAHKENSSPNAC